MASDVICGCTDYFPKRPKEWDPQEYRRRAGEYDPEYSCARLIRNGEVILEGKPAIEHFCMLQGVRS